MNVIRRRRRGTDRWGSVHERARLLAAERLANALDPDAAAWLAEHLGTCPACTVVADAYEDQRQALRALRSNDPPPPRDLWARTAAAIEREGVGPRAARRPGRRSPVPLAILSGALVVAVVVGVSVVGPLPSTVVAPSPKAAVAPRSVPTASRPAEATPFPVDPADVAWLEADAQGTFGLRMATVDEVCPGRSDAACAPLDEQYRAAISDLIAPTTVVQNPTSQELVVVDRAEGGDGDTVYVVPIEPDPSGPPASPDVTAEPSDVPFGSGGVATEPPATTPDASAAPNLSLAPTDGPPTASADPSPTADPSGGGPVDDPVAIASGVVLVGQTAAYSPDGSRFAFSARPADGSHGPDIYVWSVGDPAARALTTDHRSVFSGWYGDLLLGSRAIPEGAALEASAAPGGPSPTGGSTDPSPSDGSPDPSASASPRPTGRFRAEAFVIDPATGEEHRLEAPVWRPAVDPLAELAVYWEGSLEPDDAGTTWYPSVGRLLLAAWTQPAPDAILPRPPASPDPGAPNPSPSLGGSPSPTAHLGLLGPPQVLAAGAIGEWEARWDTDGTHLAVWVAEDPESGIGQLRLYALDRVTGRTWPEGEPLMEVPAEAGFVLADGRLAWVTPPGQDGEGSRVQIVAWDGNRLGSIETAPGQDPILIIR